MTRRRRQRDGARTTRVGETTIAMDQEETGDDGRILTITIMLGVGAVEKGLIQVGVGTDVSVEREGVWTAVGHPGMNANPGNKFLFVC